MEQLSFDDVYLEEPNKRFENQWYEIISEFKEHGEELLPEALEMFQTDFTQYLFYVRKQAQEDGVFPGYIIATTYFLIRQSDDKLLGALSLRHKLTPKILSYAGQIGIGIRPHERRKGYGTKLLNLGIKKCAELGFDKMLICCNRNNIGSKTVIEKAGAEFIDESFDDDVFMRRYWIYMSKNVDKI